ncbi:nickel pincer cofactor biosynthesis protein LarB [Flavobacteriaceae bacterium F89]|uniref:Nickel pincer cofactor biosynthesis protein LarB n=1 Tax=Cerina litoralis TaxID=2874477 RepID=A0AAE3EWL2_9FLAO|nr:nickel pincer cofactor biosynthesis protein LarB [Cerina litoralis]MCG2462218.1 nickel pincer cofactor biosynthesis protein LarB [Cerina litoralis]
MANFNIDHDRENRNGFPEVVYGAEKSVGDLTKIMEHFVAKNKNVLVTKLQKKKIRALLKEYPKAEVDLEAGILILNRLKKIKGEPEVAIISAGTSDIRVVNEAYHTLKFMGVRSKTIKDVGVAGIHRLLSRVAELKEFKVLIVVAGFEGALPTAVGGLLPQPIIAVPASVGYGVSRGGKVALNSMLASCANGIVVVNIDNGYGAAMAALRILNLSVK